MPVQLGGRRFLLTFAITAASVCLALGMTLPIIRLTKFVFWTTEHSLLSTVHVLLRDGQLFLGLTILVFSILFPIIKLLYLLLVSTLARHDVVRMRPQLRALEWLGKWSMHDVLVLALTIFFIKSQGLYDAASLWGVYFFTAGVLLMILAYSWLRGEDGEIAMKSGRPATASDAVPAPRPIGHGSNLPPEGTGLKPARRVWPFRNFILCFFIIVATVFFALGVILPVIRFTTVFVWKNEHSIATIIWALYTNQEFFLCGVLFVFSILFPFLKLFYLLTLLTSPDLPADFRKKSIATMEWLGRYSMTDVMVLALMIFYVNSSGYTEARVLPGAYYFAASALITMLAYGWAHTLPGQARAADKALPPSPQPPQAPVTAAALAAPKPMQQPQPPKQPQEQAGRVALPPAPKPMREGNGMGFSPSLAAMLEDALAPLGRITIKRIFSSGGIYCDGVLFGLASDDVIYFKADGATLSAYAAEGSTQFVARAKARSMTLPYWQVPERLYDDNDELLAWARTALGVAHAAKIAKSSKATGRSAKTRTARSKAPRGKT